MFGSPLLPQPSVSAAPPAQDRLRRVQTLCLSRQFLINLPTQAKRASRTWLSASSATVMNNLCWPMSRCSIRVRDRGMIDACAVKIVRINVHTYVRARACGSGVRGLASCAAVLHRDVSCKTGSGGSCGVNSRHLPDRLPPPDSARVQRADLPRDTLRRHDLQLRVGIQPVSKQHTLSAVSLRVGSVQNPQFSL